jgi:hypothetical protein
MINPDAKEAFQIQYVQILILGQRNGMEPTISITAKAPSQQ